MNQPKHRLLVIEDDEVEVMSLRRAMRRAGLDVAISVASDGIEALDWLRAAEEQGQDLPRLLVLDLNMPRMGGLELLGVLRDNPRLANIPVVVLTTSTLDADRRAAEGYGVKAYVVKTDSETGLSAVRQALDALGI